MLGYLPDNLLKEGPDQYVRPKFWQVVRIADGLVSAICCRITRSSRGCLIGIGKCNPHDSSQTVYR